jgi:uncharacterized protein YwlG (UPF0340 family)
MRLAFRRAQIGADDVLMSAVSTSHVVGDMLGLASSMKLQARMRQLLKYITGANAPHALKKMPYVRV